MLRKEDIIKFLIAIILYAGMLAVIDWRLRQVELARCQTYDWDICAKFGASMDTKETK